MTRRLTLICCVALLAVMMTSAQAVAQVAITNGTIHTVSGEVIEGGTVLVDAEGTITAVGAADAVSVPGGHATVDASGKILTPGLFDAHTSLGLVEIWAVKDSRHTSSGAGKINAGHLASESFNRRSANIPIQREGGITDVMIIPSGGVIQGQAAHASLSGEGTFATIERSTPTALVIQLGARAASALSTSRGGVLAMLRLAYDDARFYIGNRAKFDERRSRELSASPGDLEAIAATFDGKKPVMFIANSAHDIESAVAFAEAQKVAPIIVGGAEAWMVRALLARTKTPVILSPLDNLPSNFEELGSRADNATVLQAAGVPVIISTFESHNVRKLRQLAGNAVRAGLPYQAALHAVTLAPAEALGVAKTHGSIEVGKVANLVLWSDDPFEHSTRVEAMWIRGAEVSLDNRQKQLLERYRVLDRRGEPAKKKNKAARE